MDEVEIDFLFNVGNVSGEVHIDDNGDGAPDGDSSRGWFFDIEQAHFTYSLGQRRILYLSVTMVLHLVSSVKILLVSTPSAVLMVISAA